MKNSMHAFIFFWKFYVLNNLTIKLKVIIKSYFFFQTIYSSSDEEDESKKNNNNSVITRRSKPRILKPRNRKTSTPGANHYSMTCLERLIRAHPIWFLPKVNREDATQLLQGKETGVSWVYNYCSGFEKPNFNFSVLKNQILVLMMSKN